MKTLKIQEMMDRSGVRFGTSGARGLVADMDDEVCYAYTLAFLQAIQAKHGQIALATDLRPSSPSIAAACAAAIRHAGLEVDYCGAIPTPALAYYAQTRQVPCIMVTGSHIPFDRNGIKFYAASGEITKADETAISEAVVEIPDTPLRIELPAINSEARQTYVQRYLSFFPAAALQGIKLGFYQHSSVARDLLHELLEKLGAQVIPLGRTDEFVPIDTEAVAEVDIERAHRWAEEHHFDAILSTDGDADRPLLGDETGNWLRGDVAGILCARYLGAEAVATTVSCNTAIELSGAFKRVSRTRIGSPYVIAGIEALVAEGFSAVGFEPNGGFLVGSEISKDGRKLTPLMTRDAVLPILCLLSLARETDIPTSSLIRSLPTRYTASDRLQAFPTENSRKIIADLLAAPTKLDELLAGWAGKCTGTDQTDGLRITLDNGDIVHFRPSGNAPELRCYAESGTSERAWALVRKGLAQMQTLASTL